MKLRSKNVVERNESRKNQKRAKSPKRTSPEIENPNVVNENQPARATSPTPTPTTVDKAESLIKELFENLDSKGSYSRAIDAFIKRNNVYSKFKPTRRKFNRRKTVVHGPFNTYQMDLSDYRAIRHSNRNYGWLLFIIDAFSRYGYVIPLKYKNASETKEALETWLLSLNHLPKFIYSDEGNEFTNSAVNNLFRSRGISHYILRGVHKASIAERFQRTIKTKLETYFYKHKTKNWISAIDKIVNNYNHRYHRSIKMAPADITYENFEQVYKTLYPAKTTRKLCRLAVGDLVRVAIKKKEFSKGYHQTFSDEVYKILKAVDYRGVCLYTVQNIKGGSKLNKYYYELSLVARHDYDST